MRISSAQIYQQGVAAMNEQQAKLAELQTQISSGNRLTRPSDDPAASARILEIQDSISRTTQYQTNIQMADAKLEYQDTLLGSVENGLFRLQELVVRGNNGVLDQPARDAIAQEVDEIGDQLLALANTTMANGNYVFSGFQTRTIPFVTTTTGEITSTNYQGDQGERYIQVSQTRQVRTADGGSKIFMELQSANALNETDGTTNAGTGTLLNAQVFDNDQYVPGDYQIVFTAANTFDVVDLSGPTNVLTAQPYSDAQAIEFAGIRTAISGTPAVGDTFTVSVGQYQDLFSTVRQISDTLRTATTPEQRVANLNQAQIDLQTALTSVLEVRTDTGGRLNTLNSQYEDNEALLLSSRRALSELSDTDLAAAISQLTIEQTTLEASQAVFSRLSGLSLFNFLR